MKSEMEVIAQELLPGLRAALAKELSTQGFNQVEIAALLGISQPAVSQYLRDIRGGSFHGFTGHVRELAGRLSAGMPQAELQEEMYALCRMALRAGNLRKGF